jgi:pimeloyl-ACP methyl ester carboxylesterase
VSPPVRTLAIVTVDPFTTAVPGAALDDLRRRIRTTRWPEAATEDGWTQGVPLPWLRDLAAYWAEGYDWRRLERRLADVPQVTTRIDGLRLHALHVRSPHADATPLVLTHGWPGSFVELLDVLGPLTDPPDPADAFHVVVPSLPGYGFSDKPTRPGWGIERIADAWAVLMARLGYDRFGASGGDWGSSISTMLGLRHPGRVLGLHLTPPLVAPDPATAHDRTRAEQAAVDAVAGSADGSAYSALHATRPQTLGYALLDSPVGLAAWLLEKVVAWSDHDGDVFSVLSRDQLLDDVTLYWLTGTGASSTRLYRESIATVQSWFTDGTTDAVSVPTGAAVFRDLPRPSRRWAERRFADLRYWSEPERGGHFAAWEQPEVFVRELRASFRAMR